jgi:hypothetical protein
MAKLLPGAVSRAIQALSQLGYDPEEAEDIVVEAVSAYQAEIERLVASGALEPAPVTSSSSPRAADWDDEEDEE